MAYLDPAGLLAAAAGRPVPAADPPVLARHDAPAFSALEWTVIALARRESPRSLARPGRLARAIAGLFGRGDAMPLADPRLEALRRIAVHVWHRGSALPPGEADRFLAAGYDDARLRMLVARITGLPMTATKARPA